MLFYVNSIVLCKLHNQLHKREERVGVGKGRSAGVSFITLFYCMMEERSPSQSFIHTSIFSEWGAKGNQNVSDVSHWLLVDFFKHGYFYSNHLTVSDLNCSLSSEWIAFYTSSLVISAPTFVNMILWPIIPCCDWKGHQCCVQLNPCKYLWNLFRVFIKMENINK